MKTILIAGATGLIGSAFLNTFYNQYNIILITRMETSNKAFAPIRLFLLQEIRVSFLPKKTELTYTHGKNLNITRQQ